MAGALRKLNQEGIQRFEDFIRGGATGPAPLHLLSDPETSEPLLVTILPARSQFSDRFELGRYLNCLLDGLDPADFSHDRGFWTALALLWFDFVCPANSNGHRKPDKEYRYVLSADYRHYYRHLIRSPWQLVRDHGDNARFLLISPKDQTHPLSVHGEILEQIGGRQQVLRSRPIIAAAARMYLDPRTGRPRTGVAGSSRGSARRFGMVLRQLDLTFDPFCMAEDDFINLLPPEFERWRKAMNISADSKAVASAASGA